MDNVISTMLEAIAESIEVPKEDMWADFDNFNKAIDKKIAEGYSEEEAINIVASSWNFDWVAPLIEE